VSWSIGLSFFFGYSLSGLIVNARQLALYAVFAKQRAFFGVRLSPAST
jgi:hypothetical protein